MQKTYVIAGGTSGISRVIGEQLLNEGHRVITISRSLTNPLTNEHWNISNIATQDITQPAPEQIHGLVYAPGSINLKPFRALKAEDFLEEININLIGAVKFLQWAQRSLVPGASVVLFSTVAVQQGMPFHASVAAAKGAVEGLTRSLAAEWAPKVRVNCVAPSLTDTSLADKLLNSDAKREGAAKRHPLQRFGQPEDVAQAALFLLSEKSSWITGQILRVDGGMSSLRLG